MPQQVCNQSSKRLLPTMLLLAHSAKFFKLNFAVVVTLFRAPLAFCIRGSFASSPFSGVSNGVTGVVAPGRSKEGSQKTASPKYFLTNDQ